MRKTTKQLLTEIETLHDEQHTDPRVGPSDYLGCPKQIQLRLQGTPEDEPIEDNHSAIIGTMIHAAFAQHVQQTQPSTVASAELPVTVPGLDRHGTADLVWWIEGVVVDVKTCSQRMFDRIVSHGAKREHMGQVDAYALGLNRRRGVTIRTCVLAYVNRENGDIHEVEWDYDETSARAVVDWLTNVEQMVAAGMDMERAGDGPGTGFPCDWCPFWKTCWEVDRTPDDRSHASKFTTDDEVEGLIGVYIDSGELKREAEATQKAARQRLVGIRYDGNGVRLSWSNDGRLKVRTEDVVDVEALTALAVSKGLDVPMMTTESVQHPRITAKRTNTAKGDDLSGSGSD